MASLQMKRLLQRMGFAVSLVAAITAGLATAFNVYAISIKDTFQYTQYEVELISSIGVAGVGLCFLHPILTPRFGNKVTYIIVVIMAPFGCLLVYVGTLYPKFFSDWPVLIGLFLFLANFGSNFLQLHIIQIAVNNNEKKNAGKIIGVYSGLVGLGKIFFCLLHQIFFDGNLGGFFLTIAILWALNTSLCVVLHRPILHENETVPILNKIETASHLDSDNLIHGSGKNDDKLTERNGSSDEFLEGEQLQLAKTGEMICVKVMLRSIYFHLMFWSSVVFFSSFFSFLDNLTAIGESAGIANPLVPVYLMSVIMVLSRVLMGPIYDLFPSDRNGFILLYFTYICFSGAMIIGLTCFNQAGVYAMTCLAGVSASGGNTLPWVLLSHNFGRHNLSTIMGLFSGCICFAVLLLQIFIGFSYDREISSEVKTSRLCRGVQCFRYSFVMLLIIIIVICFVQYGNMLMLRKRGRNSWVLGQPS